MQRRAFRRYNNFVSIFCVINVHWSNLFKSYISILHHIDYRYMHPASSTLQLLSHLMCHKIAFPAMGNICGEHKIFQKDCCFEECERCKAFTEHNDCMFSCPSIFNDKVRSACIVYTTVIF
jgi:hypothetical protein